MKKKAPALQPVNEPLLQVLHPAPVEVEVCRSCPSHTSVILRNSWSMSIPETGLLASRSGNWLRKKGGVLDVEIRPSRKPTTICFKGGKTFELRCHFHF